MTRARAWIPWIAFVAFAAFIGFVIWVANTGQGRRYWNFLNHIPYGDKLGHVLLMGTLCLLLNLALGCRRLDRLLLGSVIVAVFVLCEEISQIFIQSRTFDLMDLMADAIGILIAGWVALWILKKRRDAP